MTFEEYRIKADVVAQYPGRMSKDGIAYCLMGVGGESGELLEKVKKIYRDKNSIIDEEAKEWLIKEMGDIFWYCSQIYSETKTCFNNLYLIPGYVLAINDFQEYVKSSLSKKYNNSVLDLMERCFLLLKDVGRLLGVYVDRDISKIDLLLKITNILYHLAVICIIIDTTLENVAKTNIEKLYSRKARGKLQGSGDNR